MKHKGQKNITYTQRLQIETLLNAKQPKQKIADVVGNNIRTLYYEIKRGVYEHITKQDTFWYGVKIKKENLYSAQIAQDRYEMLCLNKGRDLKIGKDFAFVEYMEKRVNQDKISPSAVLGEIKYKNLPYTNISKSTLYRYIDMGIFPNIKIEKRKKAYQKVKIKRAPKGTSIEKRPQEINNRNTFGHWEMDCICGPNKASLLVLSERLTRKEIIFKIPNQKSNNIIHCLNMLEHRYGKLFKQIFKSITVDNGSEFSDFNGMQKSIYGRNSRRTLIYYCHPYSSWERGTNERLNREIRRLIPKGTYLNKLTNEDIQKIENWLNNYPKSIFDYASANDVFNQQLELI